MKERARRDRCPPDSSLSYFFTLLKWTLSSAPFVTSRSSTKVRWAVAPGRRSLKIFDRLILTESKHFSKVLVRFSSRSCMLLSRVTLST